MAARLLVLAATSGLAAGCVGSGPVLLQGDASSAEVAYREADIAPAAAVARQHCAGFEKVPHLIDTQQNIAFFDCVKP